MLYFDWAATTPPNKEILMDSLIESFNNYGNPSSPHKLGMDAKNIISESRKSLASLLNCEPSNLFFTSGGTESNNIVALSFLNKRNPGEIITSTIEHPSNYEPIQQLKSNGWKITEIPTGVNGLINASKLEKSITKETRFISLIYVHNETGVIQDINEIVRIVRVKEKENNRHIFIHLDGVQAAGKIPIDLKKLDIDSFSVSAHKFGGPKGSGLLYLKKSMEVLVRGGGQESHIRPGTESLFNILSLTKCLNNSYENLSTNQNHIAKLMELLIEGLNDSRIKTIPPNRTPKDINFVPNILSLTSPPVPGEVLVRVMNSKGFCISTGSACSSNKKSNTKGILSMGINKEEGFSSFRISIGHETKEEDIYKLLIALKETVCELAP